MDTRQDGNSRGVDSRDDVQNAVLGDLQRSATSQDGLRDGSGEDSHGGMMSFWEHLDELRSYLVKIVAVVLGLAVVAFCFRQPMFDIILAPGKDTFVTYRLFGYLGRLISESFELVRFQVDLISTGLTQQFVIHMKAAFAFGLLFSSPYVLYCLFRFISPALYVNERKYAVRLVGSGYLMFLIGVLLNYFLIFPLTFRFLGTYQVDASVANMITLQSYVQTLFNLCLVLGMVFEIPVLAWLFAKMGLLRASFLRRYRKHAVVVIFVVAAIITPTSDVFTLTLVSLPMWLLYELSIRVVARTQGKKEQVP